MHIFKSLKQTYSCSHLHLLEQSFIGQANVVVSGSMIVYIHTIKQTRMYNLAIYILHSVFLHV